MNRIVWSLIPCSAFLLMAADATWKGKEPSQWTVQDAQQVLRDSPWVKRTLAGVLPRRTEAQQREAGRMGASSGIGLGALDPSILVGYSHPSRGFAANMRERRTVVVCWESAQPVRNAESKIGETDPPSWDGDYYAIAVYRVPGLEDQKNLGSDLRKGAFLRREGKKDLLPARVDVIYTDEMNATVLYLFSRTQPITEKDRDIWFVAQVGQLFVEQSFDAHEMKFQNKLDL
jgi:hypothetical protein